MNLTSLTSKSIRFAIALLFSAMFFSACSKSGESPTPGKSELVADDSVATSVELIADKTFRIHWERNNSAEYYRVFENPDGESGYTAISEKLDASTDYFDHHVAVHKRVNARYMVEACNVDGCMLSAQQLIEDTLKDASGYFKVNNTGDFDEFGGVVSLSADGITLAVASPDESSNATGVDGDQNNDGAFSSGAVYVFVYSNSNWIQQAYIKASNTGEDDQFGSSISLSADGNTLAIGARTEQSAAQGINGDQNDNSAIESGAVYVFTRSKQNWQQQAYIKASNTTQGSLFGGSVSLNADGNTLAVGASRESTLRPGDQGPRYSAIHTGAVYIFERSGANWHEQAFTKPDNYDSYGFFGRSVNLSGDGNTLAVGVYDNSDASQGIYIDREADSDTFFGAIHVLTRVNGIWQEQAFLTPSSGGSRHRFATGLSLSADGNFLAASSEDHVDLFERVNGKWREPALIESGDEDFSYGGAVSLNAYDNTMVVGVPLQISFSANGDFLAVGADWEILY